jgi:ribosome-associated translation inhibitor RaiA
MHIQINTADPQTRNSDEEMIRTEVESALERFAERITRVEVHVKDTNAAKGGVDKHCTIEARLSGLDPIAVTTEAADVQSAVSSAAGKLQRRISSDLDKRGAHR